MSLILEALKKSEQQRQREKAPGLHSIHHSAPIAEKKSMRPWWLFVILIALCNLAFLGYWLWHQTLNAPLAQTATGTPASTQPLATETTQPAQAAQNNSPPDAGATKEATEFTRISPRATATQLQSEATAQRIEEIGELPEAVRNSLPAMTFSFHVYSENPDQRTIIINDRRVREGDEVSAGLKLQGITPDGVILLFEQHRIHIGVLSGW